jgi:BirA family biotin operon repressor/biotin-[acetyl-CoA-carboxylase] ligase
MIDLDTRAIVPRLKSIESLALIPRVASTNLVARRVVSECIDNELSLPQAMIIAGEQFAGRGRNDRRWSSPAGKGIYATTLISRTLAELPLVPLAMANIVASFLRDTFAVDARIKWPNDILVGGRKIAGILIEARVQDERVFLLIGTGINVEPVQDDARPNSVSISEVSPRELHGVNTATLAFIEHMDERLSHRLQRDAVLEEWRRLSVHQHGDRIHCILGDRTIDGTWAGIDDDGRALIQAGGQTLPISAADIVLA